MHKTFFSIMLCLLLLLQGNNLHGQNVKFKQVLKSGLLALTDMAQDKQGFIWFTSLDKGLQRYDGINLKAYVNDPRNPNSIASGPSVDLFVDANNMFWIGTLGTGLEKFDPATNTFTHFRHNPKDAYSLSNDTVTHVLEDHLGNLWVATFNGLDLLDRKTGKFSHYKYNPDDAESIGHRQVFKIFEDKKGMLWINTSLFHAGKGIIQSALNRFDRTTGKFTRYLQDPENPNSHIPGKAITDMYEDRNGNFWIGTLNGLYNMDRNTGQFIRYYPDPLSSKPLGQSPISTAFASRRIFFINEDAAGALWIGLGEAGMNRYDPVTKMSTHYGSVYEDNKLLVKDTTQGFTSDLVFNAFNSNDGLFWVCSLDGILYNLNYNKTTIPFYSLDERGANAFYCEENGNVLWIGTDIGLVRKDLISQKEKQWKFNPKDKNISNSNINSVSSMRVGADGNLWLATRGGLVKFDMVTEKFLQYKYDPKNPGSISNDNLNYLFIDHNKNLWVGSDSGISRMDKATGLFTNYKDKDAGTTSVFGNSALCIVEDREYNIWASSGNGCFRLDTKTEKINKYIPNSYLKSLCVDSKGTLWAGGVDALYYFDKVKDEFILFANQQSTVSISDIINIIEDNQKNLWVSTSNAIIKISEDRTKVKKFGEANGVRYTHFTFNDNYKAKDGRLFLGIGGGYYSFYPDKVKDNNVPPQLNISGFKLGDNEINFKPGSILTSPIWETSEIRLSHKQNIFSFDFFAIDYTSPGDEKYLFMLENYDDVWHDIGSDHRAFFFNVPPGKYNFRVKAVSSDGSFAEKNIRIIISPPWWKTWWAYSLYALLAIIAGYLIYKYQKRYIIKRERQRTQQKELAQAKEIEKAYNELKTTQQQLIQSEKMASLGELTAGIAHEIQNPLNFVNNFSEVNSELIAEMKDELKKGNISEAEKIASDIDENEQKIIFHGRRADSIVKGMLQHSRNSSGQKEPTDINALVDECMRLSYHGLRAKDKSFNAKTETELDSSIPKIAIIPQDIGRVILNLFTNAFYSVTQKKKQLGDAYEPTVTAKTSKIPNGISISIRDNGNGVPQKVLDKIFQPFFTTKPTGEGTGLGLSMSYDIITKGHAGELKVNTKEGEYAEFIIILPQQTTTT